MAQKLAKEAISLDPCVCGCIWSPIQNPMETSNVSNHQVPEKDDETKLENAKKAVSLDESSADACYPLWGEDLHADETT